MSELKIWNHGNDQRKTHTFVTKYDPASDELKAKTLAAMQERVKANERKAVYQRKAAKRFIAVAAVLALMMVITPLGGYVVSAASEAVQKIQSWWTDTFSIDIGKSNNGCTVKVKEATLGNDFIDLVVDEDFTELYRNWEDTVTVLYENEDEEHYGDGVDWLEYRLAFVPYYYGTIYDSDGNAAEFVCGNNCDEHNYSVKAPYSDAYTTRKEYLLYAPDMKEVINSYDKKYSCELHLRVYALPDYWLSTNGGHGTQFYEMIFPDENGYFNGMAPVASMDFKFPVKNYNYVMNTNYYEADLDYEQEVDGITFKFEKMFNLDSFSNNLLVEIVPNDGLTLNDTLCRLEIDVERNMDGETDDDGAFLAFFGLNYRLKEIYYIHSRYYTLLTEYHTVYHELKGNYQFNVQRIQYYLLDDTAEEKVSCHEFYNDFLYRINGREGCDTEHACYYGELSNAIASDPTKMYDIGDYLLSFPEVDKHGSLHQKLIPQKSLAEYTEIDTADIELAGIKDGEEVLSVFNYGCSTDIEDKEYLEKHGFSIRIPLERYDKASYQDIEISQDDWNQYDQWEVKLMVLHVREGDRFPDENDDYDFGRHSLYYLVNPKYYDIEDVRERVDHSLNGDFVVNIK